jgi:hypothetical protein
MSDRTQERDLPGAIVCGLMMLLGAGAVYYSFSFSDLGAVFPRTVGAFLIGLSALYVELVFLGRTRRAAAPAGSNARRAGVAAVMLGWAFALPALGFLASSALAMALLMGLAQHGRWTPRAALVVGASATAVLVGLYLLFKVALQVPLP